MLSSGLCHVFCLFIGIYWFSLPGSTEAGCADVGKCCPGRNSSCYSILRNQYSTCYCDEFCMKSDDCCSDYSYYCRVQDCVLTYWSHWSECSVRCGRGRQERTRRIHIQSTSGGKPCDSLKQIRTCSDTNPSCRRQEVAQILPTYYKPYRSITKYQESSKPGRPSYCIHYITTYVSPYCQHDTPWHMLKTGDNICVECQDIAMDEEGKCKGAYIKTRGQWSGIATNNCFGTWKSEGGIMETCECGTKHGRDFIFI